MVVARLRFSMALPTRRRRKIVPSMNVFCQPSTTVPSVASTKQAGVEARWPTLREVSIVSWLCGKNPRLRNSGVGVVRVVGASVAGITVDVLMRGDEKTHRVVWALDAFGPDPWKGLLRAGMVFGIHASYSDDSGRLQLANIALAGRITRVAEERDGAVAYASLPVFDGESVRVSMGRFMHRGRSVEDRVFVATKVDRMCLSPLSGAPLHERFFGCRAMTLDHADEEWLRHRMCGCV